MKKLVSIALSLLMILSCLAMFAACDKGGETPSGDQGLTPVPKEEIKIGFIFLHDEKSPTTRTL